MFLQNFNHEIFTFFIFVHSYFWTSCEFFQRTYYELCHFCMIMNPWPQTKVVLLCTQDCPWIFVLDEQSTVDWRWCNLKSGQIKSCQLNHLCFLSIVREISSYNFHKNTSECTWVLLNMSESSPALQMVRFLSLSEPAANHMAEFSPISQAVDMHMGYFPVPRRLWCCGGSHEEQPPSSLNPQGPDAPGHSIHILAAAWGPHTYRHTHTGACLYLLRLHIKTYSLKLTDTANY